MQYDSMGQELLYRSSHQSCSVKKVFLEILQNSQQNSCVSLFFNQVSGIRPGTLLKKRLWHRCFPVNFVKFLRIPFLQNTSGRLLLATVGGILVKWIGIVNNHFIKSVLVEKTYSTFQKTNNIYLNFLKKS